MTPKVPLGHRFVLDVHGKCLTKCIGQGQMGQSILGELVRFQDGRTKFPSVPWINQCLIRCRQCRITMCVGNMDDLAIPIIGSVSLTVPTEFFRLCIPMPILLNGGNYQQLEKSWRPAKNQTNFSLDKGNFSS